jgi:hypothetical protein
VGHHRADAALLPGLAESCRLCIDNWLGLPAVGVLGENLQCGATDIETIGKGIVQAAGNRDVCTE